MFTPISSRIHFPIRYFPSSAVFERDNNTLEQAIVIENVKAVLNGICPHSTANYRKGQIESFSLKRTIICSFCDHSIKEEWISSMK